MHGQFRALFGRNPFRESLLITRSSALVHPLSVALPVLILEHSFFWTFPEPVFGRILIKSTVFGDL